MRRALAPRRRPAPVAAPGRVRVAVRLFRAAQQPQRAGPRLRRPRSGGAWHLVDRHARASLRPVRRPGTGLLAVGLRQRQGADLRRPARAPARLRGAALRREGTCGFAAGRPGARGATPLLSVTEDTLDARTALDPDHP